MRLELFKEQLELAGTTYEVVASSYDPNYNSDNYNSLGDIVDKSFSSSDVISNICNWFKSGNYSYWNDLNRRLQSVDDLFYRSISDRDILFKTLAKQLGYSVGIIKPRNCDTEPEMFYWYICGRYADSDVTFACSLSTPGSVFDIAECLLHIKKTLKKRIMFSSWVSITKEQYDGYNEKLDEINKPVEEET